MVAQAPETGRGRQLATLDQALQYLERAAVAIEKGEPLQPYEQVAAVAFSAYQRQYQAFGERGLPEEQARAGEQLRQQARIIDDSPRMRLSGPRKLDDKELSVA